MTTSRIRSADLLAAAHELVGNIIDTSTNEIMAVMFARFVGAFGAGVSYGDDIEGRWIQDTLSRLYELGRVKR